MKEYPILEFVRVSCDDAHPTHENIEKLLKPHIRNAVLDLPHIDNRLPGSWMNVKKAVNGGQKTWRWAVEKRSAVLGS